jgi:hypothetical protein
MKRSKRSSRRTRAERIDLGDAETVAARLAAADPRAGPTGMSSILDVDDAAATSRK